MQQKQNGTFSFLPEITELRRRIHRFPETAGNEKETARTLAGFLETCLPDKLYTGIGGHGILALFRGKKPGPSRMFRSELDALPIQEENDLPYKSAQPGAGHLCGHDGHMAILCGVARALYENAQEKGSPVETGNVYLLFQPAEETGEGAKKMAEELSRLNIRFDYSFALHNKPGFPLHTVIISPASYAYASTGVELSLAGHTSHAAEPHLALNPTDVFLNLARFLKKYDAPGTLATIVNLIVGEPAYGTAPGRGIMRFTLRAATDRRLEEMKKETEREIRRLCDAEYQRYRTATGENPNGSEHYRSTEQAAIIQEQNGNNLPPKFRSSRQEIPANKNFRQNGFRISISYPDGFPATVNDSRANRIAEDCARELGLSVVYAKEPQKGSDDFAYFTRGCSAAFFDLGAGLEHKPLHHPRFDFEDRLIPDGINMILKIIEKTAEH